MENHRGWLILNMLPNIGRGRFNRLVARFGCPEAVFDALDADLFSVPDIGPMAVESIRDWKSLVDVDEELRLIERGGASVVCLNDEEYPANLRRLSPPPPLLYYKGSLDAFDEAAVAVIGCRKMSRYGRDATHEIAGGLARAGIAVVSGLALGIDSEGHRAAIEADGRTLAVLGNGLSSVYPAQHRMLAQQVVEHGALVSEMPMAATPDAGSFPQRNSIIAGLSLGVCVVEAARQSGCFITVGHALDMNRSVFAVPGDINRANSLGTNRLIQEGAKLVMNTRDILVELRSELSGILGDIGDLSVDDDPRPAPPPRDLSPLEAQILEALEQDLLSVDELLASLKLEERRKMEENEKARALEAPHSDAASPDGSSVTEAAETYGGPALATARVPMGDMMAALLNLEIRGLIQQEPGKMFRRVLLRGK
jgi:DNA processing protein